MKKRKRVRKCTLLEIGGDAPIGKVKRFVKKTLGTHDGALHGDRRTGGSLAMNLGWRQAGVVHRHSGQNVEKAMEINKKFNTNFFAAR
jgi:hypothetical protein